MSIVRDTSPGKHFTMLNNDILKSKELTLEEKGLLAYLLSFKDNWKFTMGFLKKSLPHSESTIRRVLRSLERKGYIKREYIRENGKFAGNDMVVYDKPTDDKSSSDKPKDGKSTDDFCSTNNTKETTTKIKKTDIKSINKQPKWLIDNGD